MKDTFWFLHFLMFNFLISRIHSNYQPVIFHPETLEVYFNWKNVLEKEGPFAVACPHYLSEEESFNQNNALDHKSLFVRKYVIEPDASITCERITKLAVVMHSNEKGIFMEFGYEVYIDKSKFKQNFSVSNFNQFSPITEPFSLSKRVLNFFQNIISSSTKGPSTVPVQGSGTIAQELGFIWFSKITVQYNFKLWNVISLSYFITHNPEDMRVECQDDNLGKEFYNGDDLETYYVSQVKIFGVFIGSTDGKCVKKYNLLRPHQFRASESLISCSNLTSIPVWYQITESLLNYSEKFLVAIAAETTNKIKITAGTYEILELSIEDKLQPIYLNAEKNEIPVPRIIFKVVEYQTHECTVDNETCWYAMVIVIHNEPSVKNKICHDKCKKWGWENIQYMNTKYSRDHTIGKSEQIYCCELDLDMEKKLRHEKVGSKTGELNLMKFPIFDKSAGKVIFDYKREYFEKKMRELSEIFQLHEI